MRDLSLVRGRFRQWRAAAIRAHMFEPFATGRPEGTGLGLAIVREVAEAHGGRVMLEHRSNGTTFTLELPAGDRP